jgi:2-methylcitrate dehydratase PrpD
MASDPTPATDEDAWWSIEHAVATCLVYGSAEVLAHGLTREPSILRIVRSTTVTSADAGWQSRVEVTTTDGEQLSAAATTPLGHGDRRATDMQLAAKFERLGGCEGMPILRALLAADGDVPFTSLLEEFVLRSGTASETILDVMAPSRLSS